MAEKNRNYSVFLLVLALVGAALFYGCGSSSSDSFPAIEYSITGSYTSEGLSSVNTSARAVSGLASGILIYSESDPSNYADVDTAARTFVIRNLKPGKHYIVFKHMPNGSGATTYIGRSSKPVILTESNPVQACEKLSAEECTISIRGKVSDLNGNTITPTPILTLWGQNVEVDALTGYFTTPKMPVHTVADLIINAVNYQQTSSPLSFEDNPAYFEITAVDTGSNNVPPTVNLSSKKAIYNTNTNVTFKAEAQDANKDDLEFIWNIESCTAANPGILEKGGETQKGASFTSEYYWDSPEDDCMATISVMVREKNTVQKLSATAKLQIQIGTGHYKPNTKPIITSTTIYPSALYGKRNYTITCNATDTDGDALTEKLTISPNEKDSILIRKSGSGNEWLWTTPDLDSEKTFTLSFEVRDPKGNIASLSKDVKVLPTTPNTPPVIVSVSPTETTTIMSGKDLNLVVNAADNENDKLSFKWDFKRGDQITYSFNENTASLTWRAPILNSDTPISIYCIVSDPFGETATATFNVIITPDPNKKAPVIDITINGTTSIYNDLSLFKPNEIVSFVGKATDSNQNVAIDSSHYAWMLMGPGDSDFKLIAQGTSNATYTVLPTSTRGNYTVKMTATDIGGSIKGEETKDFRINTLPSADILYKISEGNYATVGTDGRLRDSSNNLLATYSYQLDGYTYDVFKKGESVNLIASCSDIETEAEQLQIATRWYHNNDLKNVNKNYSPDTNNITGSNIIKITTLDSKYEFSATSTYQYYVNTAPEIEVATTTKSSFIETELISINVMVNDDLEVPTIKWYLSVNGSDYQDLPATWPMPVNTSGNNSLTSKIDIQASLLATTTTDMSYKIKIVASDSMGMSKTCEFDEKPIGIQFSVISPHVISRDRFIVASGTYNINQYPYYFSQLEKIASVAYREEGAKEDSYVYLMEGTQVFSVQGYANKYQDAMTWTWYDSFWVNNSPGAFNVISGNTVDNNTLNGYTINDQFGTHTIRLEGRSNEHNISASNSITIFVNSIPHVEYKLATNGLMRFDTGSTATFTLILKEDNKYEKLGLFWTIENLNRDCNPIATYTYCSHDLIPGSASSTVDMGGANEKTVEVGFKWDNIYANLSDRKGAKRVHVCAYDAYGGISATATIDVLVNTLPVFNNVLELDSGNVRKIAIKPAASEVALASNDTEPGYEYFQDQYATAPNDIPVYLVMYTSMLMNFRASATDYEDGNLSGDSLSWYFPKLDDNKNPVEGALLNETGDNIHARFGIGENTIIVEARDSYYNYYRKNGDNTIYNSLCVATTTENFCVWNSTSFDLDDSEAGGHNVNRYLDATCLYPQDSGIFYVQFGNNTSFIERWQMDVSEGLALTHVVPKYIDSFIFGKDADGKVVATETPPILTVITAPSNHYLLLTNVERHSVSSMGGGAVYAEYSDPVAEPEDPKTNVIASYTIIDITSEKKPIENKRYGSFTKDTRDALDNWICKYPGGDVDFPKKIISMSYSTNDSNNAMGIMLLRNWAGHSGTIAGYKYDRYEPLTSDVMPPLYNLDSKELNITDDSKIRYLDINNLSQKVFITDTNNDRLIRINSGFGEPNSITATKTIDVCTTTNNYVFSLSGSGSNTDDALTLFNFKDGIKVLTSFGKFTDSTNKYERAGKVKNPKSIMYYTSGSGKMITGGLFILEAGQDGMKNRIQVIRSNKVDWIE